MRHILRSQQFDRDALEDIFRHTDLIKSLFLTSEGRRSLRSRLTDRLMFAIFYEPSTRTRISFSSAAHHLGMQVITTENARDFSSAVKGETLEDTIKVLCHYHPDVIVLRHYENGAADRAAHITGDCNVSIINAGDGKGQHPTQALLDLYTIRNCIGRLDNITVTIGGDLANGRTPRSLAYLLSKFDNVRIIFVAQPELQIGKDIQEHLSEHNITFSMEDSIEAAFKDTHAVYWTRFQKERTPDDTIYTSYKIGIEEINCLNEKAVLFPPLPRIEEIANHKSYKIGAKEMSFLPPDAILLHPLPRIDEISKEVDEDPRAVYFEQAGNGMFVRMALLDSLFK